MTVTAASVIGRTHAHRGIQRQDAYGFKSVGGALVCAVADGVSGARFGGPAADIAVSAALSFASRVESGDSTRDLRWVEGAVNHATEAVGELTRRLFSTQALAEQQCASTLTVCAVRIQGRGDMQVSVAMVGDGSVMEVAADGAVNVILGPRATRRSQELRDYLPKFRSVVVTAKHEVPVGAVLLLVTDGLAEDIRQSATVREWVVNQLRAATNTVTAAHVLSYARQRSADDLTFVAIRPTLNG